MFVSTPVLVCLPNPTTQLFNPPTQLAYLGGTMPITIRFCHTRQRPCSAATSSRSGVRINS